MLKQIRTGNEEAFQQIFEFYIKRVFRFIVGYVKDIEEAEDITQNVFIKIWGAKANIDIEKSFEGFIFTIAYRSVIDYFRYNDTKLKHERIDLLLNESIATDIKTDDLLNKHQLESLYDKALQILPPKRKEIFLLSRHNGLSNKQIAEKLGISVKTVENQMTSALSSLREFFKNSSLGIAFYYFFM